MTRTRPGRGPAQGTCPPDAAPALLVTISIMVAIAILVESALSILGLGDPNVVSWGAVIGAGRELIRTALRLTALPGLFRIYG